MISAMNVLKEKNVVLRGDRIKALTKQIRTFLLENFLFTTSQNDDDLGETDSLLEKGIIDSTGVLVLVAFLEENYGIEVKDDEIVPENLDSIKNVVTYVLQKRQQQVAQENGT